MASPVTIQPSLIALAATARIAAGTHAQWIRMRERTGGSKQGPDFVVQSGGRGNA
jgi:hypothetical protein